MNFDNIEHLLDKYERGVCSQEEVEIVEAFLQKSEQESIPGYDDFIESERNLGSGLQISELIESVSDIDALMDRYSKEDVSREEKDHVEEFLTRAEDEIHPAYAAFIEQERARYSELNVEEFIVQEDMGPLYNHFVDKERLRTCNIDVEALVARLSSENKDSEERDEAKIVPLQSSGARWKSLAGIAAIMVVVLTALVMMPTNSGPGDNAYAVVNGVEIEDPEEAMSYALSILGKTGKEFQKGTENMSHLKDLKHTSIFK